MIGIENYVYETTLLLYADMTTEELRAMREAPTLFDDLLAWAKQSAARLLGAMSIVRVTL